MRILTSICRWLSSGLISLIVSCVAFVCLSVLSERLELQGRLGVDDDVCWLALLIGPALIVVIHRGFHKRAWTSVAALMGGMVLAAFGVFQFMGARAAKTQHVPSGPFSGIEHDFAAVLGLFMMLMAALAILGAILALVARRMSSGTESRGRSVAPPRDSV